MNRCRVFSIHSRLTDTSATDVFWASDQTAAVKSFDGYPNVTELFAEVVIEEAVQHWVRVCAGYKVKGL